MAPDPAAAVPGRVAVAVAVVVVAVVVVAAVAVAVVTAAAVAVTAVAVVVATAVVAVTAVADASRAPKQLGRAAWVTSRKSLEIKRISSERCALNMSAVPRRDLT